MPRCKPCRSISTASTDKQVCTRPEATFNRHQRSVLGVPSCKRTIRRRWAARQTPKCSEARHQLRKTWNCKPRTTRMFTEATGLRVELSRQQWEEKLKRERWRSPLMSLLMTLLMEFLLAEYHIHHQCVNPDLRCKSKSARKWRWSTSTSRMLRILTPRPRRRISLISIQPSGTWRTTNEKVISKFSTSLNFALSKNCLCSRTTSTGKSHQTL